MKKIIHIIAKTEKATAVFKETNKGDQPDKKARAALFMIGFKQEILTEDPYTIKVTLKRLPDVVCAECIRALELKFLDQGILRGPDYSLEVVKND